MYNKCKLKLEQELGWTYQLFSPEHSHVNILQRAVIVLKHLGGPKGAVHMGPLVLTNVQQPAPLLKQ